MESRGRGAGPAVGQPRSKRPCSNWCRRQCASTIAWLPSWALEEKSRAGSPSKLRAQPHECGSTLLVSMSRLSPAPATPATSCRRTLPSSCGLHGECFRHRRRAWIASPVFTLGTALATRSCRCGNCGPGCWSLAPRARGAARYCRFPNATVVSGRSGTAPASASLRRVLPRRACWRIPARWRRCTCARAGDFASRRETASAGSISWCSPKGCAPSWRVRGCRRPT